MPEVNKPKIELYSHILHVEAFFCDIQFLVFFSHRYSAIRGFAETERPSWRALATS
jgi:hypothetical protein